MLLRMYTRWAQSRGFEFQLTDMLKGDGAGIKSATAFVRGDNAYGCVFRTKSATVSEHPGHHLG
jgi:protein subunit release factor B